MHEIFEQPVATKDFFYSNFKERNNGVINQRVNLSNIEINDEAQSVVTSVILFFKHRKPALRHYRFNL